MRRLIIMFAVSFISMLGTGQKLYVWCPKEQMSAPRKGFLQNDTIDLVIFDGRVLTNKSKVECTSDDAVSAIQKMILQTYPSATIITLNSEEFYKDPAINRITFKIGIAAYHAAFGSDIKVGIGFAGGNFSHGVIPEGKWNGMTAYSVKLYDYRNNKEMKKTKDISKISSKPNMFGFKTAKDCLNISYIEANQELLFFFDESLMK